MWLRAERKDKRLRTNLDEFVAKYGKGFSPREGTYSHEIIIPCYNHGRFLEVALASCPPAISVTVAYDPSTDDTWETIEKLSKKYEFRLSIGEAPGGQGEALNRAINSSPNNLFTVLNADDCLTRYAIDAIIKTVDAHPDVRLVGGGSIPFHSIGALRLNGALPTALDYLAAPDLFSPTRVSKVTKINDVNMTMSSCTFFRSAWEAVGGFWKFGPRVCSPDDRDFQLRVGSLFHMAVLDEPLAFYRTNSSLSRGLF
jgi:glycosyltransferase involved in cell wall biosynthesis